MNHSNLLKAMNLIIEELAPLDDVEKYNWVDGTQINTKLELAASLIKGVTDFYHEDFLEELNPKSKCSEPLALLALLKDEARDGNIVLWNAKEKSLDQIDAEDVWTNGACIQINIPTS